jgi:hypothetical protein
MQLAVGLHSTASPQLVGCLEILIKYGVPLKILLDDPIYSSMQTYLQYTSPNVNEVLLNNNVITQSEGSKLLDDQYSSLLVSSIDKLQLYAKYPHLFPIEKVNERLEYLSLCKLYMKAVDAIRSTGNPTSSLESLNHILETARSTHPRWYQRVSDISQPFTYYISGDCSKYGGNNSSKFFTLPHIACITGRTDCLQALISFEADLNRTIEGVTAIQCACLHGNPDCLALLCELQPDNFAFEALLESCKRGGHLECVDFLVEFAEKKKNKKKR